MLRLIVLYDFIAVILLTAFISQCFLAMFSCLVWLCRSPYTQTVLSFHVLFLVFLPVIIFAFSFVMFLCYSNVLTLHIF